MAIVWETLAQAALRTRYSPATFKKWSSLGKLPFPVYGMASDIRVKASEVDAWMESTKRVPIAYLR